MKEHHKDRLPLVADLLMDAAHADRHLAGDEKATVRKLLREIMGIGNTPLPIDLDFRIDEFSPSAFDLTKTAAAFAGDPPAQKRRLLEMCAAVHAADGELDLAEDEHLRRVAGAIGLSVDQFHDLVVDILEDVENIEVGAEDLEKLRRG